MARLATGLLLYCMAIDKEWFSMELARPGHQCSQACPRAQWSGPYYSSSTSMTSPMASTHECDSLLNIIYWEIQSIYWQLEAAKWHNQTPILVWKMADDLAPGGISSEWSNIEFRTWISNYTIWRIQYDYSSNPCICMSITVTFEH